MKLLAYFCNNSVSNKIFFITFVALLSLSSTIINAQEREGRTNKRFDKEAFLVKRSAFITAELGLTPEEAAEFMPLCEELQQKKFDSGQTCRRLQRDIRSKKDVSDAEYLQTIDECLKVGKKEAELELEYYEKFKKVLSPEKLYKFKHAELKFARDFMNTGDRRKE